MKASLTVYLAIKLIEWIEKMAKEKGKSKNSIIAKIIEEKYNECSTN